MKTKLTRQRIEELKKKISLIYSEQKFYLYFYLTLLDEIRSLPNAPAAVIFEDNQPKILYSNECLEDFLSTLTKKNLKEHFSFFNLIKHEVLHILNLHPIRVAEYLKSRNLPPTQQNIEILNVIADSLVNRYLDPTFLQKANAIRPTDKNKTLEELADEILKQTMQQHQQNQQNQAQQNKNLQNQQKSKSQSCQNDQNQQNNTTSQNQKTKSKQTQSQEQNSQNQQSNQLQPSSQNQQNNNQSSSQNLQNNQAQNQQDSSFAPNDILKKNVEDLMSKSVRELKEIKKNIQEKINKLVDEIQKSIGSIPAEVEEIIRSYKECEIPVLENEQELFSAFAEIERLFIDKSPASPKSVFLPIYRPYQGKTILLIIDTSGSMSYEEFEYVFYLIKRLKQNNKVLVLNIDTKIKDKPILLEKYKFLPALKVKGRGGTDFQDLENVKKFLSTTDKENITSVILFTDGYVNDFPTYNPLKNAKWFGITTERIPENSPKWIKWFKLIKRRLK